MNFKTLFAIVFAGSAMSQVVTLTYDYICKDGQSMSGLNIANLCFRENNIKCPTRKMKINGSGYICSIYGDAYCKSPFKNVLLNTWMDTTFDIKSVRCTIF